MATPRRGSATDSTPSRSSSGIGSDAVRVAVSVEARAGVDHVEMGVAARTAQHRVACHRPVQRRARQRVAAPRSGRGRRTGRRRPGTPGRWCPRPGSRRPRRAPAREVGNRVPGGPPAVARARGSSANPPGSARHSTPVPRQPLRSWRSPARPRAPRPPPRIRGSPPTTGSSCNCPRTAAAPRRPATSINVDVAAVRTEVGPDAVQRIGHPALDVVRVQPVDQHQAGDQVVGGQRGRRARDRPRWRSAASAPARRRRGRSPRGPVARRVPARPCHRPRSRRAGSVSDRPPYATARRRSGVVRAMRPSLLPG